MQKGRDILVVDDEAVITGAIAKICSAEGLSVDQAQSAAAGFGLLERGTYRLILCDIRMAGVDGFEFLLHVAKRRIATPVVMVTGYATVQNSVRAMFSGAIDFIPKPFTADELLAVVRRGLRYDELRQKAAAGRAGGPAPYAPYPRRRGGVYRRLGHVSWVTMERAGTVLVGVCDPFLKTVGGLKGIELSPAGSGMVQGSRGAALHSQDGLTYGMMSPVSGQVLEAHAQAASDRKAVEQDPYGQGWLYRVMPSDPGPELEQLVICSADSL